jgi:catechol 2,3-dioxygenase-like lactoylglutathione lyase family enzyme
MVDTSSPPEGTARAPRVTALQCMTIATADPDALHEILQDGLGWQPVASHPVDARLEAQWGIAAGSAGPLARVLASPRSTRGMLRIVRGEERPRSRAMAARWAGVETVVSHDLDALHARLAAYPAFRTFMAPSTWDWTEYGSNVHRAFIGSAPGGTHLAFTMALTRPPGREFPAAQAQVGHVFDVPLVTTRFEDCKRFYCGTLGMVPFLQSQFRDHLWHRLWKLPPESPARLDIYKGNAAGTGLGGIELQGYEAHLVDPEPARTDRFDGGACLVTYTSDDLDAACEAVASDPAARLLSWPAPIDAAPYFGARMFAFAGPIGERFEVVERDWGAG